MKYGKNSLRSSVLMKNRSSDADKLYSRKKSATKASKLRSTGLLSSSGKWGKYSSEKNVSSSIHLKKTKKHTKNNSRVKFYKSVEKLPFSKPKYDPLATYSSGKKLNLFEKRKKSYTKSNTLRSSKIGKGSFKTSASRKKFKSGSKGTLKSSRNKVNTDFGFKNKHST